ncbi:hypothetical protein PPYR_07346 [Photinus pyralis]|uniref:Lipase n=2 Tax=Photinus pyralis TaxID=7054 RepID=A0A1Y1N344_PHOPY|nr:hypothetical protein PPYR_07346 [Photinus pyralis]
MAATMKWAISLSVVLTVFLSVLFFNTGNNNVCKTFEDYYSNRDENQNCYYNPDYKLEVPDIVKRNGYPLEQYEVTTDDGYILTLFRIPYGKVPSTHKIRKPVFLQHGMTLNSGIYVNVGNKSLAYILADAGYDVWMGNFRGSLYGNRHHTITPEDSEFWNFSFHENGVLDLPPQIDLVYRITKQKMIFVGYSLGSTAVYVYSSVFPQIAHEKLEIIINFAPSIFLKDVGFLFELVGRLWFILEHPLQLVTNGKMFVRHPIPSLARLLCLPFPFQMKTCQLIEMIALGFNFEQNDPETLPITIVHNTDAASVKTITHLIQVGLYEQFQHFDYGPQENVRLYGTTHPLSYNLSVIRIPSYTFHGENDKSVSEQSLKRLYDALPKDTTRHGIYRVEDKHFNHLNFITAKDIVSLVYKPLIKFLDKL